MSTVQCAKAAGRGQCISLAATRVYQNHLRRRGKLASTEGSRRRWSQHAGSLLHGTQSGLHRQTVAKTSHTKLDLDFAGWLRYKQRRLCAAAGAGRGFFTSTGAAADGDLKPFRDCKPLLRRLVLRSTKLTATQALHAPGQPHKEHTQRRPPRSARSCPAPRQWVGTST